MLLALAYSLFRSLLDLLVLNAPDPVLALRRLPDIGADEDSVRRVAQTGHRCTNMTVRKVQRRHGVEPAPCRSKRL